MELTTATLEDRLGRLREEFAIGQRALAELDARRDELAATMLRINGAIGVLEELLTAAGADEWAKAT